MRTTLLLLFVLSLFSSCDSGIELKDNIWIGDHACFRSESGEFDCQEHSSQIRKLLTFTNDSIEVWHSAIDYMRDDLFFDNKSYSIIKDLIVVKDSLGFDTVQIEHLNTDSIVMKTPHNNQKLVYQSIKKYSQSKYIDELKDLMTNHIFSLGDSNRVEFTKSMKIITPSLDDDTNSLWIVDTFQNELFLVYGGFLGSLLHVRQIDDKGFTTKNYYKTDKEFRFAIRPSNKKYKYQLLLGDWRSISQSNPPREIVRSDSQNQYYEREKLEINSDYLIAYNGFRIDTMPIELSQQNDIMYVRRIRADSGFNQWNINKVTQKEMEVVRKSKIFGKHLDTIKYKRI
jgi:hypothetical protein